ncbi:hypothetical protein CEY09_12920 [Achromobacter marplatensis]|uniref:Lipoprotein 13 n=1 Tax=Achromobacter marplatensis TaxID=470868 RepID=A0ABX9GAB9_9BURK|nr:hypothetical protein [Achromobacter marplatensis]OWT67433.1 hypothetical protein CEY09_12920 [Achromobacter marplatensis]RBP20129.1 hypothetical protein DFP87_104471 [Achromobacter marplatensis]CAB3634425.1 hypothetical protein LMG26219_01420 [Achromobacter marplatensis]
MNAAVLGARRTIRLAGAGLMALALSACGVAKVDEVSVKWPPFRDGTPVVLPSDPTQCPDLTGTYQAQGEYRSGDREAKSLNDLRNFLIYPLDLQGMRDPVLPEWQSTPAATVAFTRAGGGWDVLALDGRGARSAAYLPELNGAQDTAALAHDARAGVPDGIRRHTGCAQGRLWVSVRHDWRQYESMGVRRHVALFRPEAGGLLVTVRSESDSIGLLPWYSNEGSVFQYWFAPAAR